MKKNVKDLKYPDVIHITSQEEHDKIKKYHPNINNYQEKYFYYLLNYGCAKFKSNYENQLENHIIYEINELIFDEDEKFIKGQWYNYNNCYFKFDYKNCNLIYYTEIIENNKYNNKNNYISNLYYYNQVTLLTDLLEIQKYLPDNHINKIQKNPQIGEFWFYYNDLYKIEDIKNDVAILTGYKKNTIVLNHNYSLNIIKKSNNWKKATFKDIDKANMTLEKFNEVDKYFNNTFDNFVLPSTWYTEISNNQCIQTSLLNYQESNKEIIIPTIVKKKIEITYNLFQKVNEIILTLPKIEKQ